MSRSVHRILCANGDRDPTTSITTGSHPAGIRPGPWRQSGLSLIEILVAVALGLLIVAALLQVLSGTRASARLQEGLSRVQESGRFALELIKPELRLAGLDSMCALGLPPVRNHLDQDHPDYDGGVVIPDSAVLGWEYLGTAPGNRFDVSAADSRADAAEWTGGPDGGSALTAYLDGRAQAGSDVLLVRYSVPVVGPGRGAGDAPSDVSIRLQSESGIGQGALVVVSDCQTADLFQNTAEPTDRQIARQTGGGRAPGNRDLGAWTTSYGEALQIYHYRAVLLYVARSGVDGQPGLYRRDLGENGVHTPAVELIRGVENMQVLFGVGEEGVEGYVTAGDVDDWSDVRAVRLALLVRSDEEVNTSADARSFMIAGTEIAPVPDRRIRQVFETTVAVRNTMGVR